jgi:hypothetical protein
MDIVACRQLVERLLTDLTVVPFAIGDVQAEAVFDRERDRYLVMLTGWQMGRRVHGCLVHVDIRGDKLWIQRDGTEWGLGRALLEAGVPREQIVAGFRFDEAREAASLPA